MCYTHTHTAFVKLYKTIQQIILSLYMYTHNHTENQKTLAHSFQLSRWLVAISNGTQAILVFVDQ